MTLILEPTACSTPARRRALPAAPVLIRVPVISVATSDRVHAPLRRRRLRREVRVAGYWLLVLIPLATACVSWGTSRTPLLLAVNSPERIAEAVAPEAEPLPSRISLRIEPVALALPRDSAECSVFLSGQLLPADALQEAAHGGY